MSKVEVDFGLCESNGVCMGIIPEVFDLDDQDYLHILGRSDARERKQIHDSAPLPAAGHLDRRQMIRI
jgi:ferredoxin